MRVLRNPALLAQRALLTAAAFPAQHIRSALSFERRCVGALPATARAYGVRRAIQPRLRSGALGRNTSRRAAQAQSRRLARPAVCACSASCRRLPAMLRAGKRYWGIGDHGSARTPRLTAPSEVRSAKVAHSKRCKRRRLRRAKTGMYRQRASGGAQASGARAQSAARARQTPRGGVAGRREVSRPSHASRIRGWMQRAGPKAVARWRSETQPRNAVAPVPTVADNAPAS